MSELNVEHELDAAAHWEVEPGPAEPGPLSSACVCLRLAVVTYVHRIGFAVGVPAIAQSLGLDQAQVGYLMAAFLLAYGAFQVPGGLLGDRLGGRRVLTMLVLGWSLFTGASRWPRCFPAERCCRSSSCWCCDFSSAMFQAGGFPTLGRVVADWMPLTERGSAQGAIWMFSRWGGALIPFLLAWLFWVLRRLADSVPADRRAGFALVRRILAVVPDRPEEMPSVNRGELKMIGPVVQSVTTRPLACPGKRWPARRSVWSLCLMYGFTGFSGNFFTSMLPLYLAKQRHLSDGEIAWLSALPLAAGSVACILGGAASDWAIRRFGNRKWGRRYVGFVGLGWPVRRCSQSTGPKASGCWRCF